MHFSLKVQRKADSPTSRSGVTDFCTTATVDPPTGVEYSAPPSASDIAEIMALANTVRVKIPASWAGEGGRYMRIALFQPDIPQNTGTILRLAACLSLAVDIIEPCGFVLSDKRMRRAGLDYLASVSMARHPSWEAYQAARSGGRLVLLTTQGPTPYTRFEFRSEDDLLFGQEGAGVPPEVHGVADARLRVPMAPEARSLNVAVAVAMVVGEALRQLDGFYP